MEDDKMLLDALDNLPVSELERADWIAVGMALKAAGYGVEVWDKWSQNDSRYKSGECARKWRGFKDEQGGGVGCGTIIDLARRHGWEYVSPGDELLDWDSEIEYDGDDYPVIVKQEWNPIGDLIRYLELVFDPDDVVGYVTSDTWFDGEKWKPRSGAYDRTAGELLKGLYKEQKKAEPDIGAVMGDAKREAGAWVRFNALDGKGVKNENVTKYKYALVESDTTPIPEQDKLYRKLELPIVVLVHSGNKSLHAIVRVDAVDAQEYKKRVEFLYNYVEEKGKINIDRQNSNPSRLSRLPGFYRGDNRQYIVATNIGRSSWSDWMNFVEGTDDTLPSPVMFGDMERPELAPELIKGVLRRGHKLLVSGSSKTGKSFFLMETAMAISEGVPILMDENGEVKALEVVRGKVFYINLEIDDRSFANRMFDIYEARKLIPKGNHNLMLWNLRGHSETLDKLVPKIIREARDFAPDAVIIDPIYKVITGDENSASEMGKFCNQFDRIAKELGCSMIYCHHHSKGAQGAKKAIDRSSGSGVFGRDPDAIIDIIPLEPSQDQISNVLDEDSYPFRLEFTTREFKPPKDINVYFRCPLHVLDVSGELEKMGAEGSPQANLAKGKNGGKKITRETVAEAFNKLAMGADSVPLEFLAENLDVTEAALLRHIRGAKADLKKVYVIDTVTNDDGESEKVVKLHPKIRRC